MADTNGVVQACLNELGSLIQDEPLTVEQVQVGVFYTVAQLSSGHVGVAFTPRDLSDTVCCPRSAAAAPRSGRLAGEAAWDLVQYSLSRVPLRRAVGVAVLNALSALALEQNGVPGGRLLPGVDALEAAEVGADDRVAMVGAFAPFVRTLKGNVADVWVVDKHPGALKADEQSFWRPPEQAGEVLAEASVVIITGSALVEGGIDDLLEAARQARRVILAGPTASPWPPPFFQSGVHVMGGIRVLDAPALLRIVGEGGSGYLFEQAAEKVSILRSSSPKESAAPVGASSLHHP